MRLLLDSMMPVKIARHLQGHDVTHVVTLGWQQLTNGKLLAAAEAEAFDVLITKDGNMPYQQNIVGRSICVVVLKPESQDFDDLVALAPNILRLLPDLKPGTVTRVSTS